MRGAVPEDKGDKDQVTHMYTSILIGLSISYGFWWPQYSFVWNSKEV